MEMAFSIRVKSATGDTIFAESMHARIIFHSTDALP
jgi:hypothetical protein